MDALLNSKTNCISKLGQWRLYSQTHLIRPLLIRHFRLIRRDILKTLSLTPMLNQPFN